MALKYNLYLYPCHFLSPNIFVDSFSEYVDPNIFGYSLVNYMAFKYIQIFVWVHFMIFAHHWFHVLYQKGVYFNCVFNSKWQPSKISLANKLNKLSGLLIELLSSAARKFFGRCIQTWHVRAVVPYQLNPKNTFCFTCHQLLVLCTALVHWSFTLLPDHPVPTNHLTNCPNKPPSSNLRWPMEVQSLPWSTAHGKWVPRDHLVKSLTS